MKFTALLLTATALAAVGSTWSDTAGRAPAEAALARRQAQEQQDEARYRICDAQRADNPATRSIDFTADGRRCLISALEQAASVQGTLVLLRNASATLYKDSSDRALRTAALGAVGRARVTLADERAALGEHFTEQAATLDLAEFSIHLPQQHYQQQVWRLEAFWGVGKVAGLE